MAGKPKKEKLLDDILQKTRELKDIAADKGQNLRSLFLIEELATSLKDYQGELEKQLTADSERALHSSLPVDRAVFPNAPQVLDGSKDIGDLNLLMTQVSLVFEPAFVSIGIIAHTLIHESHGLPPSDFKVVQVLPRGDKPQHMVMVRWKPKNLSFSQLLAFHQISKDSYDLEIKGPKGQGKKGWEKIITYSQLDGRAKTGRMGIFLGPNAFYGADSMGLTVTKQFGRASEGKWLAQKYPDDWLCRDSGGRGGFWVELREVKMRQEDFIALVVQISHILGQETIIARRNLLIEVFRALGRVGIENISSDQLQGLKEVLATVEKVLLFSLKNPEAAKRKKILPQSVLVAGTLGVGKTLLNKVLLSQDLPAILVSVDSGLLVGDLLKSQAMGGSVILETSDRISKVTQLPVILLVDDVEAVMAEGEHDPTLVNKLLNLFQGIRQRGFYMIATTNHPEKLDPRLIQPGRFRIVHAPLPNLEARKAILRTHLRGVLFESLEVKEEVIQKMAGATAGWPGRFLSELCMEAGRLCEMANQQGKDEPALNLARFEEAKNNVLTYLDVEQYRRWDREIRDFVTKWQPSSCAYL